MSAEFSDPPVCGDGSASDTHERGTVCGVQSDDAGARETGPNGAATLDTGERGTVSDQRGTVSDQRVDRDSVDPALQASTLLDLVVELQRDNEQLRETVRRLEEENSRLAQKLERRGRERQYVLDHYEHRLRDANQELEQEKEDSGAETRPGRLVDALVSGVAERVPGFRRG
jgi:hypothetical protein